MGAKKTYDVFISHYEDTGSHHADIIKKAFRTKGYSAFASSSDKVLISGKFRNAIDGIIRDCKIFVLILNYDTLEREEVIREISVAKRFGKISNQNPFWIFRENKPRIPRTSDLLIKKLNIRLNKMSQTDFKFDPELFSMVLEKYYDMVTKNNPICSPATPHGNYEKNLIDRFVSRFKENGYLTVSEIRIGNGRRADLVLHKEDETILCEFKLSAADCTVNTLRQLLAYGDQLKSIESETKIRLMLIAARGFFDPVLRERANDYSIELCVESDLDKDNISIHPDQSAHALNRKKAKSKFPIKKSGSVIHLDQTLYSWTDKVTIRVTFPDSVKGDRPAKTIGNMSGSEINIATSKGVLRNYALRETRESSGVFQGSITLTGFKNDVVGHASPSLGVTSGIGPDDGLLSCSNEDILKVTFRNNEESVVEQALIQWTVGTIQWIDRVNPINNWAILRVIDPDESTDLYNPDTLAVRISSNSNTAGIMLNLKETSINSGIFQGKIYLSQSQSNEHSIHVSNGDSVKAEYIDKTLPKPHRIGDEVKVSAAIIVYDTYVKSIDRIKIRNPRIVDRNNRDLSLVVHGKEIWITCDLKNCMDCEQQFVCIVSSKDSTGMQTPPFTSQACRVLKRESITPSLKWIPDHPGVYSMDIFICESIDDPVPLSPPTNFEILVS